MGEEFFKNGQMYLDGQPIGFAKADLSSAKIEKEEIKAPANWLKGSGSVAISISEESIQKFKEFFNNLFNAIKPYIEKIMEILRNLLKNNPELVRKLEKYKKYEKRVKNRQILYIKRKRLGKI